MRHDRGADGLLSGAQVAVAGIDEASTCALRSAGARIVEPATAEVFVSSGSRPAPGLVTIAATTTALGTPLTVSASDLDRANRTLTVLAGSAGDRGWPADVRLAAPPQPKLALAHPVAASTRDALALTGLQAVEVGVGVGVGVDPTHTVPDGFDALVVTGRLPVAAPGCAVTVEAGPGGPALTVLARAFEDAIALDLALALTDSPWIERAWPLAGARPEELVVFGAHLRGGSLTHQLTDLGARWAGEITTAPRYRMSVLPTAPAKPAVTRVRDDEPGAALYGQRWVMSAAALGRFLAALPPPMQLGKVEFDDGSWRTAFGCDGAAATGPDISVCGSWPAAVQQGMVTEDVAGTGRP